MLHQSRSLVHLSDKVKVLLNQLCQPSQDAAALPTRQGHADTLALSTANTELQAVEQNQTAQPVVEQFDTIAVNQIQVNSDQIAAIQAAAVEPEKDKQQPAEEEIPFQHQSLANTNDEASEVEDDSDDDTAEHDDKSREKTPDPPGLNLSAKQKKRLKQRLSKAKRKAEAEQKAMKEAEVTTFMTSNEKSVEKKDTGAITKSFYAATQDEASYWEDNPNLPLTATDVYKSDFASNLRRRASFIGATSAPRPSSPSTSSVAMADRRISSSLDQRPRSQSRKRTLLSPTTRDNQKKQFLHNEVVPTDDSAPPTLEPTVPPGDPLLDEDKLDPNKIHGSLEAVPPVDSPFGKNKMDPNKIQGFSEKDELGTKVAAAKDIKVAMQ